MEAQVLRRSRRPRLGQSASDAPCSRRRGFTLVEMLVAMALTLIMVYAIAEFYAYVGDTVRDGRAMIEMGSQLRATTQRLKSDLDSLTVRVVPWTDEGNNSGYFEYLEGGASDLYPLGSSANAVTDTASYQSINLTTLLGDMDDYLAGTIRSDSVPFTSPNRSILVSGSATPPNQFTSRDAEFAWWTGFADTSGDGAWQPDEPRFLYRRELIIAPHLNEVDTASGSTVPHLRNAITSSESIYDFHQIYDISARPGPVINGVQTFVANSLADLARRENRFAHVWGAGNHEQPLDLNPAKWGFPNATDGRRDSTNSQALYRWVLGGDRKGEDVMLSNLLAFDVRAYDQDALVYVDSAGSVAIAPGDAAYPGGTTVAARGAYVDLNYNSYLMTPQNSVFSAPALGGMGNTYDTWALSYERFGPGDGRAMNGLDDDNNGIVDDEGERATTPPYDIPLRGAQVKIRVYDTSSRQVRQATVTANFAKD